MTTVFMIIGAAVLIFLAVLLIRAAMFTPKPERERSQENVELNEEKIVKDMQEMIRCKTISYNDDTLIDKREVFKVQRIASGDVSENP